MKKLERFHEIVNELLKVGGDAIRNADEQDEYIQTTIVKLRIENKRLENLVLKLNAENKKIANEFWMRVDSMIDSAIKKKSTKKPIKKNHFGAIRKPLPVKIKRK